MDLRGKKSRPGGAFLHDIGKMAIPDNILRKPEEANSNEN